MDEPPPETVKILFRAVGEAPQLKQDKFKIDGHLAFIEVLKAIIHILIVLLIKILCIVFFL